jgi:hypothetical protein
MQASGATRRGDVMAKSTSGVQLVTKSVVLWLTVAVILASVYGALLSVQSEPTSLIVPETTAVPVVAVNEESFTD